MKRFSFILVLICFPVSCLALSAPVSTYCNISAGKFYTFSKTANPTYPDLYPNKWTNGIKLTDEAQVTDNASYWVGWYDTNPFALEIVVDLGKIYTIDTVKLQLRSQTSYGIYFPQSLQILVRSDVSGQWTAYGNSLSFPSDSASYSTFWAQANGGTVQCRYIKYVCNALAFRHLFLGELEIWGNVVNEYKSAPDWGCYYGCYAAAANYDWDVSYFETTTGSKVSMALWYHFMNPTEYPAESDFNSIGRWWNKTKGLGTGIFGYRYLEIGWLPYETTAATIAAGGTNGDYDAYFETWFTKSINKANRNNNTDPIWIRPMNEFNGSWTFPNSDGYLHYGGDPVSFKRAWRRMYNIAQQVGAADKHVFVWSSNAITAPAESWNMPDQYYPGDQYVDVIGVSLYPGDCDIPLPSNIMNGTGGVGCFDFLSHWTYKPLMVAEGGWFLGASVSGIDWVNDWFDLLESNPRFKSAVWFTSKVPGAAGVPSEFDMSRWPQDVIDTISSRVENYYSLKSSRAGRLDYNKDYAVNFVDFNRIAKEWARNGAFQTDINGDNYVNWPDILIFAENWLK